MDREKLYQTVSLNRKLILQVWLIIVVSNTVIILVDSPSLLLIASLIQVITVIWLVSEAKVPAIEMGKAMKDITYARYQMINEQDVMNLRNNEQDFELRMDANSISILRK